MTRTRVQTINHAYYMIQKNTTMKREYTMAMVG